MSDLRLVLISARVLPFRVGFVTDDNELGGTAASARPEIIDQTYIY
jgi:hypothetical protein